VSVGRPRSTLLKNYILRFVFFKKIKVEYIMMTRRAFTSVELLFVVVIMGILAAITASQFVTAKQKANDTSRKGDLNAVSKALNQYFEDYGKMPMANTSGQIVMGGSAINWGEEFKDSSGYSYMKKLPTENKKNFPPYCYKVGADGKSYVLLAMLENKSDSQCVAGASYDCGNRINAYCFAYSSLGVRLDSNGNIL
jgi:type II secretory pathway pseudopilin PulG